MLLKKHIASRFLNHRDILIWDIMRHLYPELQWDKALNITDPLNHDYSQYKKGPYELADKTFELLKPDDSKNYWVTDSVLDTLNLLKIALKGGKTHRWSIFKNQIPEGRYTFIFPKNQVLRMLVQNGGYRFISLVQMDPDGNTSKIDYAGFYYDCGTGELSAENIHLEAKKIEPFVFRLLCFMFLTPNDELELKPGQKAGTKKSGKVINSLDQNITIVNSRWNTTVIRNEGFGVSGHLRLQPCGKGRERTEIIYIAPFTKNGYVRKAKGGTEPIVHKNEFSTL